MTCVRQWRPKNWPAKKEDDFVERSSDDLNFIFYWQWNRQKEEGDIIHVRVGVTKTTAALSWCTLTFNLNIAHT